MTKAPKKCVVDTNVPIIANLATKGGDEMSVPITCVSNCINCIDQITREGGLVLDDEGEIFEEYMSQGTLSLRGAPGMGDKFIKWIHDNQWNPARVCRVSITKVENSYAEFPEHEALKNFDKSDRKFVAVANAHPQKPPILQATDSKWWGWKDGLKDKGIEVLFLCSDYVREKYTRKADT